MENIYEQTIRNAENIILKTSNHELSSEGYNLKVFNLAKICIPKLNIEQTKVDIKKEEISFLNAPPGISFSISGSRTIEYVIYSIPISGDIEQFGNLVRPYIDRRTTYVEYKNFVFKEYSDVQISGNDELINQIKNRFISLITNVNKNLIQLEDKINDFHETRLKPIIDELIISEISNRNLISDSKSKLNPFI